MTRAWDAIVSMAVIRIWPFLSSRAGVATVLFLAVTGLSVAAWHFVTSPAGITLVALLVLAALDIGARCRPRLHFQPFNGGETADGSARPSLLRALIRAELHRLVEESARLPGDRPLRLDQAGPYEDQYDLGAVGGGLSPLYKLLSAVTGQLINALPSRARLVSGFLVPTATAILGIETVDGKVERMATIKWDDLGFPPSADHSVPDELVQLAMPAAAWILLTQYDNVHLGGTRDWASYVAFTAGCAWQALGDLVKAEELYRAACADPANSAPAINLAKIEWLREQERERADGAQRVDPASRVSFRRLSRIIGDPAIGTDNPQWYRARNLQSAGLRDGIDDQPAPTSATAGQAAEARKLAVDMASAMIAGYAAGPQNAIPSDFFRNGRAAALTLVARQVIPVAENLRDVSAEEEPGQDYTDGDISRVLGQLAAGELQSGTSELLVRYARRNLQLDDQAYYNLARFHHARAKIYADVIDRWERLLLDHENQPQWLRVPWTERVKLWQDVLEQRYRAEVRQALGYQAAVREATSDPVLAELAEEIPELPAATSEDGSWHHHLHGSREQPPAPTTPPDTQPWRPEELPDQR